MEAHFRLLVENPSFSHYALKTENESEAPPSSGLPGKTFSEEIAFSGTISGIAPGAPFGSPVNDTHLACLKGAHCSVILSSKSELAGSAIDVVALSQNRTALFCQASKEYIDEFMVLFEKKFHKKMLLDIGMRRIGDTTASPIRVRLVLSANG